MDGNPSISLVLSAYLRQQEVISANSTESPYNLREQHRLIDNTHKMEPSTSFKLGINSFPIQPGMSSSHSVIRAGDTKSTVKCRDWYNPDDTEALICEQALSLRRGYHPYPVARHFVSSPPPPPAFTTHVSALYPEILAMIFSYLDVEDKGRAAQVCQSWREACYDRSVWRGVEARLHLRKPNASMFAALVRRGIKKVQVLSLRRSIREVVQGVPNLDSLNLQGCCNVTDSALSHGIVAELPTITRLDLSNCKQVTDTSLGRIAQYLKNLEVLELGGCSNISNTGLLLIAWGLRNLKKLNLRSCWLVTNQGIANLAGLNRDTADGTLALEELNLQDCQRISDEALRHISVGLLSLKSLNLTLCMSVTDTGLKFLAKMPSLSSLNLRSCDNISDVGISYLAEGGSRLSALDVSFCVHIVDQALVHIAQGLSNLKALHLCACNITDDGLVRIAKSLQQLETLKIGQCTNITDRGVTAMAESLKNLKNIDLYGCTSITNEGLDKVMKMPQMNKLNLVLWYGR